ncbi:MAG: CHASE2 domain-containing protein, partial [Armatimonadetes bacterium]|nr:CHASE2 domain-containing protein [Armatimonadota bacterium]
METIADYNPATQSQRRRFLGSHEAAILVLGAVLGLASALIPRSRGPAGDLLWRLELTSYDWRLRMRAVRPRSEKITIVGVDNTSLQLIGSWPWPREYHAELIRALQEAGARVIVFDMLFDLPSSREPVVNGVSRDDLVFARAIRDAGNVVLICELLRESQGRGDFAISSETLLRPYDLLARDALGIGVALVPEDVDGVVRRVKLLFDVPQQEEQIPFVGAVAAAAAEGEKPATLLAPWLAHSHHRHPWMDDADYLIDYRAPPTSAFTYVPYADVLTGRASPDLLRGRVVFVGMRSGLEPDLKLHPV